ncbi:MAG: type IV secretion protein DotG [Pseudomonadota bacterium]
MSDDLDDDLSLDDSFDDFEKKDNTLGDLWRNNPLFKIGALAGGAILIFLVISMMGGEDSAPVETSVIGAAPDIQSTPGTEEASPAYVQAIEELNEAEIERAMNEGDSALPVPIEPPVGIVSLPEEEAEAEDPLQRWRRLQEERLEREIQQREATVVPEDNSSDVARQEAVAQLADTMAQQMSSILETQNTTQLSSINLTSPDFLAELERQEEEAQAEIIAQEAEISEEIVGETILPAGEILYAQLMTEANTDAPGPILAEIMEGPLKGSRILGTFEEQNELLTLNFDTVVYEEESLSVDAVALDPATTLPGMATEVDHRYFKRVVLPAAAAFVEGMASAISESGLTTVTVEGDTVAEETEETDTEQEVAAGIEEAGQEIGEILDDIAQDVEILVRIEAGTPLGILFLEPVVTGENL